MKELLVASGLFLITVSCTGPQGEAGPIGPKGPQLPGLYFVRVFQQGVYFNTYNGQIQSSLFEGMAGAYYTNVTNPVSLGTIRNVGRHRALFKFDLSSLPSSKIAVEKSELTLKTNAVAFNNGAKSVKVFRVTTSWMEYQAGWERSVTSIPWAPGGDFSSNTVTPNAASYDMPADCTITIALDPAMVQNWMMNPSTNYGVLFKTDNEDNPNYSEIYSSGAAEPSNRPMLKIWYYTTE